MTVGSPRGATAERPGLVANDHPPTYGGHAVDSAGLLTLARAAMEGETEPLRLVDEIYDRDVIGELARRRRRDDLARLGAQWRKNVELLPQLAAELNTPGAFLVDADPRRLRAEVLAVLLDPDGRDVLEERVADLTFGSPSSLRGAVSRLRAGGDEPIRLIAAMRALESLKQRLPAAPAQSDEGVDDKRDRSARPATGREIEHAARRRRRDRWIVAIAIVLLAGLYPTAYLGELLSRDGLLRDDGAALLRDLGAPEPVLSRANWATAAIVALIATALLLCIRRRWRAQTVALACIVACGVAAVVLALLLPGIRDSAWENELARLGTPAERVECTTGTGVAYTLRSEVRQPMLVGPGPLCQRVSRLAQRRGETVWQRWIPHVHISRIHKFASALVVGGTYEGRLVTAGLAPLTGRERWRRACAAPAAGGGAIAFSIVNVGGNRLGSVRLRCSDGRTLRVNAANGRRLPAN